MLRLPLLGTLALWGAGLLSPQPCAAYCRTTTVEPPQTLPADACQTEGYPLFWPLRHLQYSINRRGVPGLSEDQLRDALEQSFSTWTDVVCGEEPIQLVIEQEEQLTSLEPRPKDQEPRISVITYVPADEWTDKDHALAITNMRYNRHTGHILGADLLLNGAHQFEVCPDTGCEGAATDLINVVTHEAGHFLGLAHSDMESATMWWNAATWDTGKRSLEFDDVAGVCAIYGPNAQLGPPQDGQPADGRLLCSLMPSAQPARATGWAALGLGLWLARRRRR
jgi:hypothetical protein